MFFREEYKRGEEQGGGIVVRISTDTGLYYFSIIVLGTLVTAETRAVEGLGQKVSELFRGFTPNSCQGCIEGCSEENSVSMDGGWVGSSSY